MIYITQVCFFHIKIPLIHDIIKTKLVYLHKQTHIYENTKFCVYFYINNSPTQMKYAKCERV